MVFLQLVSQFQRCQTLSLDPLRRLLRQAHNELLKHHSVKDLLDVAFTGQQPFAACITELLSHHEGPATLAQFQQLEALAVLFWAVANLKDGLFKVVIDQEVLDR